MHLPLVTVSPLSMLQPGAPLYSTSRRCITLYVVSEPPPTTMSGFWSQPVSGGSLADATLTRLSNEPHATSVPMMDLVFMRGWFLCSNEWTDQLAEAERRRRTMNALPPTRATAVRGRSTPIGASGTSGAGTTVVVVSGGSVVEGGTTTGP